MKKERQKRIGAFLLGTVLALGLAVSGTGAYAEISETTQAPGISTNQGLGTGADSAPSRIQNQAGTESEKFAESSVRSARSYSNKVASDSMDVVNNLSGQVRDSANQAAGPTESYTGVDSISGLKDRVNRTIDDLGTGFIGSGTRLLYYASFAGIIIGLIGTAIGFIFKAVKVTKWLMTAVFCMVIYGLITSALGISLLDNPLSQIFGYLIHG